MVALVAGRGLCWVLRTDCRTITGEDAEGASLPVVGQKNCLFSHHERWEMIAMTTWGGPRESSI